MPVRLPWIQLRGPHCDQFAPPARPFRGLEGGLPSYDDPRTWNRGQRSRAAHGYRCAVALRCPARAPPDQRRVLLQLDRREISFAVYINCYTDWNELHSARLLLADSRARADQHGRRRSAAVSESRGSTECHVNSPPAPPARWPRRARPTAAAG